MQLKCIGTYYKLNWFAKKEIEKNLMLPCFFNKKKMRWDGIEFGIGKGIAKSDEHKIFGIWKIGVTMYGKTNTQTL